jgi:hypothetical protein
MTNTNMSDNNLTIGFKKTNSSTLVIDVGSHASGFLPKFVKQAKVDADIAFVYTDEEQYNSFETNIGTTARFTTVNSMPTPAIKQEWVALGNPYPGDQGLGGNDEYANFVFDKLTKKLLHNLVIGADGQSKYTIVVLVGCPVGASFGANADLYASALKEFGVPVSTTILVHNPFDVKTATQTIEGARRIKGIKRMANIAQNGLSVIPLDSECVRTKTENEGESISTLDIINEIDKKAIDLIDELCNRIDSNTPEGAITKGTINDSDVVNDFSVGGYCVPFSTFNLHGNVNNIIKQIEETNYIHPNCLSSEFEAKKAYMFIEGRELTVDEESKIKAAVSRFGIYSNATDLKDRYEIYPDASYLKVTFYFMQLEKASVSSRISDKTASDFGNNSQMSIAQQVEALVNARLAQMQSAPVVTSAPQSENKTTISAYLNPNMSNEGIKASKKFAFLPLEDQQTVWELRAEKNLS